MTSWLEVEINMETGESPNEKKSADSEQLSDVWNIFTRIDDTFAKCNLCQTELPCKNSITDLTKHREVKHSGVLLKCDSSENEPTTNEVCDMPAEENCFSIPHNSKDSNSNDVPTAKTRAKQVGMKLRTSQAWKYFTLIDKTYAKCKTCHARVSHLSISNLMRHVIRKHPCELLARARNGTQKDVEEIDDDDDSDDYSALEPQDQSSVCDVEEGTAEKANRTRKNISDDESPELHCSKRMKTENSLVDIESEDVSMNENLQPSQDQNSVLENNTALGKARRVALRSYVWKVFTKLKNGFSQCQICGATMSKTACVSNLLRHIKRAHPSFKAAMQKKLAASGIAMGNSPSGREKSPSDKSGRASSIIHTFEKAAYSDGEISEPLTAGGASDSESPRNLETAGGASDSEPPAKSENAGGVKKRRKKVSRSKRPAKSDKRKSKDQNRRDPKAGESQRGCLLSERFVHAVEEENQLLRSLQDVVERQGQTLDRIAAFLEDMSKMPKNGT